MRDLWNRCDVCGRFISLMDFGTGGAVRRLVTPDSDRSGEEWETLCDRHAENGDGEDLCAVGACQSEKH